MIISTEGIVLKTYDLRETSRIAVLYTKDQGKISGVMKGIRKDPRKFGSSVDKFSLNDIVYYEYKRTDLHLISQCDLKQFYGQIRQDYRASLAATYMVELVDHIMPQEHPNPQIYALILDYLHHLDCHNDIDKLVHILQVKMLGLSGFKPHIDSCVVCQELVSGRVRFSLHHGGLVCEHCTSNQSEDLQISQGAVSTLLFIERHDWAQCLRLGITVQVRKELKYLLNNFLVYHLERKLKTEKYLYQAQ